MGKNIPKRRFKEFIGSGEWEEKKIREIFPIVKSGNRLPKDLLKKGNIPFIIATVENNGIFMKIDSNTLDYHGNSMKLFKTPSITFSIDNPEAIFLQDKPFFTSNIMRVLNNENLSKNQYIFLIEVLRKLTDGFDWSIKFSGPVVLNSDVNLPSPQEQEKIGNFFEKLDGLIDLNREKLEKLKNIKSAYLSEMFPKEGELYPKRRFAGFTEPWQEKKLGEITESIEYGLNASATIFDGKNKYIRITDIDDDSRLFIKKDLTSPNINFENNDMYKLKYRDILFARTGASVGKTYIYKKEDGLVYYAGFLIKARVKNGFSPEFIFYNTLTDNYKKYIKITSQRSGQPGINAKEYGEYKLSIPSSPEQEKIGNFFKKLDEKIILQEKKIEKLENMKKAYLSEMFV